MNKHNSPYTNKIHNPNWNNREKQNILRAHFLYVFWIGIPRIGGNSDYFHETPERDKIFVVIDPFLFEQDIPRIAERDEKNDFDYLFLYLSSNTTIDCWANRMSAEKQVEKEVSLNTMDPKESCQAMLQQLTGDLQVFPLDAADPLRSIHLSRSPLCWKQLCREAGVTLCCLLLILTFEKKTRMLYLHLPIRT